MVVERSSSRGTARIAVALLGALAIPAFAADMRSIEVERRDARYHVQSETFIDAPVAAVFDVLTDYDHFDRISSVFEESRFLERDGQGGGVVYTKARGCILFFCQTIERTEQLEVVPCSEIVATVIPERSDTRFSHARWQLAADSGGTRVHYELEMEPDFWVPPVIGPMVIKRVLKKGAVRAVGRVEQWARDSEAACT